MKSNINTGDLSHRMISLGEWLDNKAGGHLATQRHLDPDTTESAYWHSGYHQALSDILMSLGAKSSLSGI